MQAFLQHHLRAILQRICQAYPEENEGTAIVRAN
jgi:hypothetical protein